MFLNIFSIVMQCMGLGCILFAVECFKPPIKRTKKNKITGNTTGDILAGIFNLFVGVVLFGMFGIFFIFGDFPGESLPIWTLPISIGITFYLYFIFLRLNILTLYVRERELVLALEVFYDNLR